MAIRSKGPMGLSTKILLASTVFLGIAVFKPDAIFYIALAGSVLFVFRWWSSARAQKSGRLIPPLLLVGMPWGIFDTLYTGVAAGEHMKEGFFMDSLTYGAMIPFALYFAYLIFLLLLEVMIMIGEAVAEVIGDPDRSQQKNDEGPLSKYWWI